jgi:shikimate dehydrogenase/3-dehydroquinate dehydratase type I
MRLCVPIAEKDASALGQAYSDAVNKGADMIELRLDLMQTSTIPPIPSVPTIATVRDADQGGRWKGGRAEKEALLREALARGCALVDLEETQAGMEIRPRILSHHDFNGTPKAEEIVAKLNALSARAEVAKAAYHCETAAEASEVFRAGLEFTATGKRFVLIGMGEAGKITRVRHARLGSEFTFCAPEEGKEVAPGQLPLAQLRRLGDECVVTGIIGWPLGHSVSPPMHEAAFKAARIDGIYLRLLTRPGQVSQVCDLARMADLRGFNVTIPHKEAVMQYLDRLDPAAESIGAVNTVVNNGRALIGHNTDVEGIRASFAYHKTMVRNRHALILGAGGAAKAAAYALAEAGAKIDFLNRDRGRAEAIAPSYRGSVVEVAEPVYDIIVNCTPLGMKGQEQTLPISEAVVRASSFVMDMVYNPPVTPLMRMAMKEGVAHANGRRMLVAQAAAAFKLWTGKNADEIVMNKAFAEAMK